MAAILLKQSFTAFYKAAYPLHFYSEVITQSENNNIPPSLMYAVIWTESGFNPKAQSSINARGLMQITNDTYDWAAFRLKEDKDDFDKLYDTTTNIKYGAVILRLLTEEFKDEKTVLAAYHAGWGSVKRWLANEKYSPNGKTVVNIPFLDTQKYVKRVMDTREIYKTLYGLE